MSVEIKVRDWDDEEYDDCGSTAVAILKVGHIKIPLCMDCVNELQESIDDFCRPQYCYQCKYFKNSPALALAGVLMILSDTSAWSTVSRLISTGSLIHPQTAVNAAAR